MGKILKVKKLTTFSEGLLLVGIVAICLTAVYFIAPGLKTSASKQLNALNINTDKVNNDVKADKLPLPSKELSSEVKNKPLMRIAEYAWNGNQGMIEANGGPNTTKGSLMEQAGINLEIVRLDGVDDLRNMQLQFIEELAAGNDYPNNDKSAFAVSIMGDGYPYYVTTTQNQIDAKFGKGKYHVQNIGAIGLSFGEDKLIGPKEWKYNPQLMKGKVISGVIGDGDWVLGANFASVNKIKVNPDPTTYDADAVNFVPAPKNDFIEAVKDLIKSQKTGYKIPLKEVKNGKLTGKTIDCLIDGAVTWTPGDKVAFDALPYMTDVVSTRDFVNQMATSIIVVKEWALREENQKAVIDLLRQTYVANNQIKLYDEWAVAAAEATAKTYNFETGKYWYDLFKGQTVEHDTILYHIGGTQLLNYADAMQYFGISDGKNRYKAVYDQVSLYLTTLNPCGFNESCKDGVIPYDDAVNLYFLKSITDVATESATKQDYSQIKTERLASGSWNINFETGQTAIKGSDDDLKQIYNLLMQSEEAKLEIIGYTDNVGKKADNQVLSEGRANAVVNYLTNKGVDKARFQSVLGKGDSEPIASNSTESGRAQNRRVVITLLK